MALTQGRQLKRQFNGLGERSRWVSQHPDLAFGVELVAPSRHDERVVDAEMKDNRMVMNAQSMNGREYLTQTISSIPEAFKSFSFSMYDGKCVLEQPLQQKQCMSCIDESIRRLPAQLTE